VSLSLLALRVEFQPDDDIQTTGTGEFDLSSPSEPDIDAPPHDREYFQAQVKALASYYKQVSGSRLLITGYVPDTVFTLPQTMAYYNPATDEQTTDQGLVMLFRDAVLSADTAGVDFSSYDVVIVFHAGVGRDLDLGYDPTPRDIPSAFLTLEDLKAHLAGGDPGYTGIPVSGGTVRITEGILLPETQSQEGYSIGLLGTSALMFGFQLGLPALWDTENGMPGIGRWGLMDQGSGNFYGLIPAEPCAWSKVYMGWEVPVDTMAGNGLEVSCPWAAHPGKIYRIPVSESEYYLVECRLHDPDGDGVTTGLDESGQTVTFLPTGQIEAPDTIGVIVEVDEYDYDLPGSGILIWHIDEKVIRENLARNRVNSNKERRGVDLEEADGAQDIGEYYDYLEAGYGAEAGVMHDAWFRENTVHQMANGSDSVAFTPGTYPSTRSNDGGDTHLVFSGFSSIDTVMHFSLSSDRLLAGFPRRFGIGVRPFSPMAGDLDGDGRPEMIIAGRSGRVFAWQADGSSLLENEETAPVLHAGGDTIDMPVALWADEGLSMTAAPVTGDIDRDGSEEVAAALEGGLLIVWENTDLDGDGLADSLFLWDGFGAPILSLMWDSENPGILMAGGGEGKVAAYVPGTGAAWTAVIGQGDVTGLCRMAGSGIGEIAAVTDRGEVARIAPDGTVHWQTVLDGSAFLNWPASGIPEPEGTGMLVVTARDGFGWVLDGEGGIMTRFNLPEPAGSDPALADWDGDGFLEIAVSCGSRIELLNLNGSFVDYYPAPYWERTDMISAPLIADLEGKGGYGVIVQSGRGNVEAYDQRGEGVSGYPLAAGGTGAISPLFTDLDGDGNTDLAAVADGGWVWVWKTGIEYSPGRVPWGAWAHDSGHTGLAEAVSAAPVSGRDVLPARSVYNYPNPTRGRRTTIRYRLEKDARVEIAIFDLSGELIQRFPGPGQGGTENEAVWELDGVESGVYLGQVTAAGPWGEKAVTIKIAVVK
jgi:M6 family metalloprotease-like protein